MKLLQLTHSVNPAMGGPVEVIRQTSAALRDQGHEVAVACLDRKQESWLGEFPFPIYALGQNATTFGYSATLIPWLRENVFEFDGVLCHGLWAFHGQALWRVLRGSRLPYFVFPHGMLDPWFKKAYPVKHLKKTVYWLMCERFVLGAAKGVLFTCERERELARATFPAYCCNEEVVTLGTSRPTLCSEALRAAFFERFPGLGGKRLLLFLGRLHSKKGCDLLMEAFAKTAPGMHLVFAGPCADDGFLQKLKARARGLPVSFLGLLEGDLKWGALAAAEAFILPSHQENFGMAVAESLAVGTPVLISDQVNIWKEIQADGAGLVAPDTLEGTEQLLAQWQRAERARFREAASSCFSRRFDIRSTAEKIVSLFQNHG